MRALLFRINMAPQHLTDVQRQLDQLYEVLKEEWDAIPQEDLDILISSIPRRVGAVIEKSGSHTRY